MNENIKSGQKDPYQDLFEIEKKVVAKESDFYIFIARQSDGRGVYNKLFIDVKLPKITSSGCPDNLSENVKKVLESKIQEQFPYIKDINYTNAVIAKGIDATANYLNDIKDCCQKGGDVDKCLLCKNTENISTTLVAQGFEKVKIQNTGNYPSGYSVNKAEIEDNAKLLFTVNGASVVDIPTNYISIVDTLKKQGFSVKVFITKNEDVCVPVWETITQVIKSGTYDIVYWHHIYKGDGVDNKYLFSNTYYKAAPNFTGNDVERAGANEFIQLMSKSGNKVPNLMLNALKEYLTDDNIEVCDYRKSLEMVLNSTNNKNYATALFKTHKANNLENVLSSAFSRTYKAGLANVEYNNYFATRDFFYSFALRIAELSLNTSGYVGTLSDFDITKGFTEKSWEKFNILLTHPTFQIYKETIGEFPSLSAYKEYSGNYTLTKADWDQINYAWLESDRNAKSSKWIKCMEAITKNRWEDRWSAYGEKCIMEHVGNGEFVQVCSDEYPQKAPFGIVNSYYEWIQHEMVKKFPHPDDKDIPCKSRWAVGASYLVSNLENAYIKIGHGYLPVIFGIQDNITPVLMKLNKGIASFAVRKFNNVLYGTEVPVFYEWDRDFIRQEQVTIVAFDVYNNAMPNLLYEMDKMTRHESITGKSNEYISYVFSTYIADFSFFGDCHVNKMDIPINNWSFQFGAAGRYHIPLMMLYPEDHLKKDNIYTLGGQDVDKSLFLDKKSTPIFKGFPKCEPNVDAIEEIGKSYYNIKEHFQKMSYK